MKKKWEQVKELSWLKMGRERIHRESVNNNNSELQILGSNFHFVTQSRRS